MNFFLIRWGNSCWSCSDLDWPLQPGSQFTHVQLNASILIKQFSITSYLSEEIIPRRMFAYRIRHQSIRSRPLAGSRACLIENSSLMDNPLPPLTRCGRMCCWLRFKKSHPDNFISIRRAFVISIKYGLIAANINPFLSRLLALMRCHLQSIYLRCQDTFLLCFDIGDGHNIVN